MSQQTEVLERYLAGEKAHRLAKDFQVHRTTIAKLVAAAGIRRPRSLTPEQSTKVIHLYAKGWSCDQIGRHLDKSAKTIWRALKQAGVRLRDTHGRER
jgi:DNA-binding NarL/FixJ family response regulator